MLLPLTEGLIRTTHFDGEMSMLADRHYSRRTVGARQFLYSGRKLVLRNSEGTVLFGWIWPDDDKRMDSQTGYNCAIFRNESARPASQIILEAERLAFEKWGPNRLYTYVDPAKTATIKRHGERIVGFCFRKAGWKPRTYKNGKPHLSLAGQWLFIKPYHAQASQEVGTSKPLTTERCFVDYREEPLMTNREKLAELDAIWLESEEESNWLAEQAFLLGAGAMRGMLRPCADALSSDWKDESLLDQQAEEPK